MKHVFSFLVILSGLMVFSANQVVLAEIGETVILEDFSSQGKNGLPSGWKANKPNPIPAEVYQIIETEKTPYLHATGRPNRIFKKMKWNPNEYPFITWKWRMINVPDDPEKERNATVYVALGTDILGIPIITKYAWSSIKAVGTESSGGMFRPTTIVLQSGQAKKGEWVTQTLNVLADYRRLHDEDPPNEAYGIGILTTIEAEFAEIIAHK